MHPLTERAAAEQLIRSGMNDCAVGRATGISRGTIREWRWIIEGRPRYRKKGLGYEPRCPRCEGAVLDAATYAYLLGMYLGDGYIAEHRRRVFRLRIALDVRQPGIIEECAVAMANVCGRRVLRQRLGGCVEVSAYWKHWICVFPQSGTGRKHTRRIELAPWQDKIVRAHPDCLPRGFIHSGGCRVANRVNGKAYPRYHFINHSDDIRKIFCRACDDYGVSWTQPKWQDISIARRSDVAKLDLVIGPKT